MWFKLYSVHLPAFSEETAASLVTDLVVRLLCISVASSVSCAGKFFRRPDGIAVERWVVEGD